MSFSCFLASFILVRNSLLVSLLHLKSNMEDFLFYLVYSSCTMMLLDATGFAVVLHGAQSAFWVCGVYLSKCELSLLFHFSSPPLQRLWSHMCQAYPTCPLNALWPLHVLHMFYWQVALCVSSTFWFSHLQLNALIKFLILIGYGC